MGYMPGIAECVLRDNRLVYADMQGHASWLLATSGASLCPIVLQPPKIDIDCASKHRKPLLSYMLGRAIERTIALLAPFHRHA